MGKRKQNEYRRERCAEVTTSQHPWAVLNLAIVQAREHVFVCRVRFLFIFGRSLSLSYTIEARK